MYSTLRTYKRMKQLSDKRRASQPLRDACCRIVLRRAGYRCQAKLDGCEKAAIDTHEILPRGRGGDPHDPENCLALCRPCHIRVTDNPDLACELGLTISKKYEAKR